MSVAKNTLISLFLVVFIIGSSIQKSLLDYSHKGGEQLNIQVGSITSIKSLLPYSYYRLGICKPNPLEKEEDTLGEILSGEVIYKTNYEIYMNKNEYCKVLCSQAFDDTKVSNINKIYNKKYVTNWYLDKLPAGFVKYNPVSQERSIDYSSGIPIGYEVPSGDSKVSSKENKEFFIYNHYQFIIYIHKQGDDYFEIVGFNIIPASLAQSETAICGRTKSDYMSNFNKEKQKNQEGNILFTYDVIFEESDITMASRWDHYRDSNQSFHWIGIATSNFIVVILSSVVLIIFCRAIKQDVDMYNLKVVKEDFIDENGWKQVSNDVFRPGKNSMLLTAGIGSGIQLSLMFFFSLLLSVIGFMKPEQRGNLLSLLILYFVLMGFPAGYISARFYKLLNGKQWLKASIMTAIMFPGIVFLGYSIVNIILVLEKSSAAVNFLDILSLLVLWLCCASPLTIIGSFFGVKTKTISIPCKVNAVPTYVPDKPWYFKFRFTFWVAGLIGFSTIFIELIYIMASLWKHQIYFMVTSLWIGAITLLIVSTEISVIFIYISLCKGDYVWWWKSFFLGGSSAIFVIIYSILYFTFSMNVTRLSAMVVYFGLMGLISAIVFLMCGSLATLGTFAFVNKIYSMIKID